MDTYHLVRDIPVEEGYDLVVAGGGIGGSIAAIAAGRLGARVLLVEGTGCLGGMGTSGLVNAFDPMANGEEMLVGGLMRELVETMYARGYLQPGIDPNAWRKNFHQWTPFKLEGLKLMLDEWTHDAGVEVRFFTRVIDADAAGDTVGGVVLSNVEGYRYVRAKTFIDATGDAVLATLCGVPCREPGRDTERPMPSTLASLFANVQWPIRQYEEAARAQYLEEAYETGLMTQCDRHLPGLSRVGESVGYLNGGHLFNLNALRCKDLTDGMMLGRKIAQEYLAFYKKYIAGCEDAEIVTTATLMGVRESRRIVGEYELNIGDYMARRHFHDQIGLFNKFVDIHPLDTSKEAWQTFRQSSFQDDRINPGESFGIPYGILVPKGFRNLWVAGRCTCSDVKVHGSIRVMPACAMMGQAAGTAAVQAIHTGQRADALDTAALVTTLRAQGAYLPQTALHSQMTRA